MPGTFREDLVGSSGRDYGPASPEQPGGELCGSSKSLDNRAWIGSQVFVEPVLGYRVFQAVGAGPEGIATISAVRRWSQSRWGARF